MFQVSGRNNFHGRQISVFRAERYADEMDHFAPVPVFFCVTLINKNDCLIPNLRIQRGPVTHVDGF